MSSMASKEHIVLSVDNKYRPEVDTSSVDPKKLSRKIDLRTIPWLALLYLLNSLDRSSIGNGRIYGLEGDLRITDNQYLWALTCFFFPYAFFEVCVLFWDSFACSVLSLRVTLF